MNRIRGLFLLGARFRVHAVLLWSALTSVVSAQTWPDFLWAQEAGGATNCEARALAVDPAHPNTLYAGTWEGLYKSTDAGRSWSKASAGLTNPVVWPLAVDPANPQTALAGTFGGGIFKTTDGGDTWAPANTGLTNLSVITLVVDPTTPATLYVATWDGTDGGVFSSTDSAGTWVATGPARNAPIASDSKDVIPWLQSQGWGYGRMQIDFSIDVLQADASAPLKDFTPTSDSSHS